MQHHLSIDIETFSSVDIKKSGAYKYAESDDFEILLLAYKLDDAPTQILDLASGDIVPERLIAALKSENYVKHAYNAAFEWWCLNHFGLETPLMQWRCTMVHGMYLGYPSGLAAIGSVIGLSEDEQKLSTGKALIRYFCNPCKPTKANGGRTRNRPEHDLEKWNLFKVYCVRDVDTEHAILQKLNVFPMPAEEVSLWHQDIMQNAYGVRVDTDLIHGALTIDADCMEDLTEQAKQLTGLSNPKSNAQFLGYLQGRGVDLDNTQKSTISDLISDKDTPQDLKKVLTLKQMLGKSSVAKYKAMDLCKGSGDRVRGLMQYYGSRTGRWAGRLVQIQNLPRNYIVNLDLARSLIKRGDYKALQLIYGNAPDVLSQLIRTAFIPSDGRKFVVADFSAIEARVIAWLAGEEWVNDVFATHGKIYEATASQMFHVPMENIVKGRPEYALRQKGKVATLALGYQGGVQALIAMGALSMGLSENELPDIVDKWRKANPHIVRLWYAVGKAALAAINTATPQVVASKTYDPDRARDNEHATGADSHTYSDWFPEPGAPKIVIRTESDLDTGQIFLTVQLPSKRKLYYPKPFIAPNAFDAPAVHFSTMSQTTRKWMTESTYGGKLVENIVQAIARDCLAVTLRRIWAKGYDTVFHVHDEVIVDAPQDLAVDQLCEIMSEPIPWAPGLVLKGAGFEGAYYMKD